MLGLWDVSTMAITFVLESLHHVIRVIMSTVYFYLTFLLVPIVVPLGDFLWQGVQRCFFPYDHQIVQEIHSSQLTVEPERSFAFPLLPRKTSKYTGFAFDSPGYESFFASQQGVYAPQKAWDVIRRASERTKPKTLPKK